MAAKKPAAKKPAAKKPAAKKPAAKKPAAKKPAAKKTELKTKPTGASVDAFLATVTPDQRRTDARELVALFERVVGAPARMYGSAIVAFGDTVLRYDSGRTLDWFLAGFSPRKASLVLYLFDGHDEKEALLAKLGKHSTGKSCLYVNTLADVDRAVLEELVRTSVSHVKARNR